MIEVNNGRYLCAFDGIECQLAESDGQPTYGRLYRDLWHSADIRKRLGESSAEECIRIGNEYARNPHSLHFRVVRVYDDHNPERSLTCYSYAIGTFGSRLEKISGTKMETFRRFLQNGNFLCALPPKDNVARTLGSIELVVKAYFNPVDVPQDGDLVVFSVFRSFKSQGQTISGIQHAGIYRILSDGKSCIESKWGPYRMPYVFEHEHFFSTPIDGDELRVWSLKDPAEEKNEYALALERFLEEKFTVDPKTRLDGKE
jgi:hypothetical protein